MTVLDCVEIWVSSLRSIFEFAGAAISFTRTHDGRPKHSCSLNLRRHQVEVDLVVWESGEAELIVKQNDGHVKQEHFGNLLEPAALSAVLARVLTIIRFTNPGTAPDSGRSGGAALGHE